MIALDTETAGMDFHHGCRPFFVVTCDLEGRQQYWEWSVDPLTRLPSIPQEDLADIANLLRDQDRLVFHNTKFDVSALNSIGLWNLLKLSSVWPKIDDTLIAAHLIYSNSPKDLTSLGVDWLGIDLQPLEDALERCVKEVRSIVHQAKLREKRQAKKGVTLFEEEEENPLTHWRIAEDGDSMLPSAGKELWRADYWLPRAYAEHMGLEESHEYWMVLRDYALQDPAVTLGVWLKMEAEINRRNLKKFYEERMKVLPITYRMEQRGVTLSGGRLDELKSVYSEESKELEETCVGLAESLGFELTLPKGASPNNSLKKFIYEGLKLPVMIGKKSKTGTGSLDKDIMAEYLLLAKSNTKERLFLQSWQAKKKRTTSLGFMESYASFWREQSYGWYLLHPTFNITGTSTLRFSCVNPNTQQISKFETQCERCDGDGCGVCHNTGKSFRSMKYVFGPAPGREWYSFDAKNIELRLPFYESGEKALIDLFEKPDEAPFFGSNHLLNFSVVYPDVWAKELKNQERDKNYIKEKYKYTEYQWVKNGGFAIQYQAGDKTADAAFRKSGARSMLKSRFAKLEELNTWCCNFADRHGYIETIVDKSLGLNAGYPLACTRNEWNRIKPTIPLSYRVQGSAMWWTMKATIRVEEFFAKLNRGEKFVGKRWPGGYYICLQVHDELVTDMPKGKTRDYNLPIAREVQRLMALGGEDYSIPTPVGCELHQDNWAEGLSI